MARWFQTWNRHEYKEWAVKSPDGYLLLIIRKEKSRFLTVKAKLIMKETGLPDFEMVEEKIFQTSFTANKQLEEWKK